MNDTATVLFIAGIIVGYGIAKFFSGRHEGVQGRLPSLIFRVKGYNIHIHHWMWSCAILLVFILLHFRSALGYGFFTGIILQGLHYWDRFHIIYKV
jgi:hypothetical protein